MKFLTLLLVVFSLSLWANPLEIIKSKDIQLQKLLKLNKSKSSDSTKEEIKVLINSIFDFAEMGKKALGSKAWKSQDSNSQAEFISAFQKMVENASVKKLDAYESDSTSYGEPDLKKKKAKITANVFKNGKKSVLVYKLKLIDGEWKAWDLVIDDLSTMRNYREQFRKVLKKKSFAELVTLLQEKS